MLRFSVVWVRSVSRQDPKSQKKKGGAGKINTSKFIFLIIRVNLSSIECIVISSYSNVF